MKKQNFFKGSLILMISAAAAKILGALFKIPLTNMLGGVGMGYFSCAYSLFMPIYALVVTGLSTAVARMTAQSAALGIYENARRIRKTALILFSAAGAAGSLAVIVFARPFCRYAADCTEAELAVLMIAPSVLFGCITAVERGYYEGLSNMYPTAFSQIVEGLVKVGAGLFLCGFVMKNEEAVLAYFPNITDIRAVSAAAGIFGVTLSSVGAALYFAVMRLFGRNKLPKGSDGLLMSRRGIARELVSTALPVGISAVVTNLTALIDMGTVIGCISYFGSAGERPSGVTEAELPHFIYGSFAGIALTVFNLVPSVTNMLGKGILPSITEAWEKRDSEQLKMRSMQALTASAAMAVPAAFGIGALSGEILTFLFPGQSDEVSVCINALRLLMPGMVCLCVSYPLFSMLQAIGKAAVPLKIMITGAVLKLVGNIILIPFMGVDGAAVSTSICYVFILAAAVVVYFREAGIKPEVRPFLSILYSGAMCGAAAYLVSDLLELHNMSGVIIIAASVTAGAALYFIFMALLRGSYC